MHADLWGWFHRFAAKAAFTRDPLRQQLPLLYDRGWRGLREEDGAAALTAFREGLQLSRQLNEACWELFFDYWIAETYIFYLADYRQGLEHTIKVVAYAHKPRYEPCPVRSRAYYTLLYSYYLMDSIGYEEKIREMADYIRNEIPMDSDTDQRVQYIVAALAFDLEAYEEAEEETLCYLDMAIHSAHRKASGYNLLRRIAFAKGQVGQAFDYAYQVEHNARRAHLENSVGHALLWQAAFAQRLGDEQRADSLHHQGIAVFDRYDLPRLASYYDAVCDYYEQRGDLKAAIELRRGQLNVITQIESIDYHCHALLQAIRLLGRAGEHLNDELEWAYQVAQELLKPQRYIEKLQRIQDGNYAQYPWQE